MKRLINFCFAIVAIAITSQTNAQDVVQEGGPARTYSVTPSGTVTNYFWSVSGGASGFANSDAASQTVTWTGTAGNTYNLSVYPRSNNGCNGATQTITVSIVATLTATVTWDAATTSICPYQAANNVGGGDPSMGVTLAGPALTGPWSLKYSIDGAAEQTYAALAGTTPTLTFDQSYTNASPTNNDTHTIKITQWTVEGTTYTPTVAAQPTLTVTVWPTPSVSGIVIP